MEIVHEFLVRRPWAHPSKSWFEPGGAYFLAETRAAKPQPRQYEYLTPAQHDLYSRVCNTEQKRTEFFRIVLYRRKSISVVKAEDSDLIPFLKWAGGKQWLLPHLKPLLASSAY